MNIKTLIAPAALIGLLALPVVANADTINQRLENQHSRIEQGIRSGELTYREQRNVESRDASIYRTEQRDRACDNGRLTGFERKQLNQQLNNDSRAIYRDKHNGVVQAY